MDFTTMGTIGSYIRQKNLNFAARYKTQTGQNVTDANGILNFAMSTAQVQSTVTVKESKKKSDEEVGAARVASIRQKLANGRRISDEEMSYLREREPKTYKKAKHADEAREELKGELKKAKTKQEAKQAVTQAMIKASAQASADIAAYKSNTKSSNFASVGVADSNSLSSEVGGLSSALNSTASESWSKDDAKNFSNEIFKNQNSGKLPTDSETSEYVFSDPSFEVKLSGNHSKNFINNFNRSSGKNSPQEVMENFIATIRALEAEWAQFTNSKEYAELPNNKREEEFLKAIGEKKHQARYSELDKPNTRTLNAVAAYRTSMLFRISQFIVADD